MSNFPRFGRTRHRPSTVAPPFSVAAQPRAAEPKPDILSFQPANPSPPASPRRESSPRRLFTPEKKATSLSPSPKYEVSSVTRVVSPPPATKAKLSSPVSLPNENYVERSVAKTTTPPRSPTTKSRRTITPPLSPLALPRTQVNSTNEITSQPRRIQPEVEKKSIVYNKTADKPAKSDRSSAYGSGEPHRRHQAAEAITLTGHNVGAVMEINQSTAGHRLGDQEITKKNKTEDGAGAGVRHGNEEKKTGTAKKELPMTAFMNSNFQSVNNSVLYESSCNHRDPGLHLALSDAADGDGATVDGQKNYKP